MPRENWPFSLFFHETPFRLVRNIAEYVLLFFEKNDCWKIAEKSPFVQKLSIVFSNNIFSFCQNNFTRKTTKTINVCKNDEVKFHRKVEKLVWRYF